VKTSTQASTALVSSEEIFRLLVESVKDYAIYMLDPEGIVVSWNAGAERIKGYCTQEILGRHFSCFYPREDVIQDKPMLELQQATILGRYESEGQRVRKDGSRFWVNAVVTAIYGEDGQLRGFAKVTRDITERKQAEEARQQLLNDLEKRVKARTAELSKANLLLRQEITERQQAEIALRQSETQLKQQAQELQKALHDLQQTQAQLVQSEKISSLGQLVAGVAHEINNPVSFIYGNLKHAESYVQTLLHLVQLYQAHHPELVEPVRSPVDPAELDFICTDLPKTFKSMQVGAERIRQIVLSLRNFSRLDEAEIKAVDLHEGIENTLLILQHQLKANNKRLEIQVVKEYGNLPLVECYAGQLNQVLINILSNAIDALDSSRFINIEANTTHSTSKASSSLPIDQLTTEPTNFNPLAIATSVVPTIWIRTQVLNDDHVQISITDNGSGMTEVVKKRLFEPFFTTKPIGKGTGLGLSISYQVVVEKHHGQLKCFSTPNQGTEFQIILPLQQTAVSVPQGKVNDVHLLRLVNSEASSGFC
jgi:two-component system, NtrC family, sensor kinase